MIFIKTIGVIIREFEENDKYFIGTRKDLVEILKEYDVKIIGIPIDDAFLKLKSSIDLCNGIILSGGNNFCENDFKLVEYLYKNNIPTLGICLGMQTMAEYFNKRKQIKVTNHYTNELHAHKIKINKESLLYQIIKKDIIDVNSRHYDAILDTNMFISAKSFDNIIEAVEIPQHKFFLGVQWHPESLKDQNSKALFDYFIKSI